MRSRVFGSVRILAVAVLLTVLLAGCTTTSCSGRACTADARQTGPLTWTDNKVSVTMESFGQGVNGTTVRLLYTMEASLRFPQAGTAIRLISGTGDLLLRVSADEHAPAPSLTSSGASVTYSSTSRGDLGAISAMDLHYSYTHDGKRRTVSWTVDMTDVTLPA